MNVPSSACAIQAAERAVVDHEAWIGAVSKGDGQGAEFGDGYAGVACLTPGGLGGGSDDDQG